ncbi:hypothetical protein CEUSTIGMA_g5987.t1 [Chlamydomonas eustigma]|uniref:Uncharacterized protein n=1 Tax=Chlamydomonas eustigma TaxID=1157962 RepID=A0A250X654_9CHLO|nr:hypothetical protein CEUSTIGMA_g5987.t1 [Chlamydomonas eustigma]|eukprot:GAX78547.1 hypothetical protein CEUSTIGMA_g5987.t1 [Chlamydomonas eustigma]
MSKRRMSLPTASTNVNRAYRRTIRNISSELFPCKTHKPHGCIDRIETARIALIISSITTTLVLGHPAFAQVNPDGMPGCSPGASCVSTSALNSPSSYMPPWLFSPDTKREAFRRLMTELQAWNAEVLEADESAGYIRANVPGEYNDSDDVQLLIKDESLVLFRSQAQRALPDPPFCFTKGCTNGPRNRSRMERLRDSLGWSNLETDEDKSWRQIFLH